MPTKEDRLREIALVEVDEELDKIGPVKGDLGEDWTEVYDLRFELKSGRDRGVVYKQARFLAAQAVRLMVDIARGQ